MKRLKFLLPVLTLLVTACEKDPETDAGSGGSETGVAENVLFEGGFSLATGSGQEFVLSWEADVDRIGLFKTGGAQAAVVDETNLCYVSRNSADHTAFKPLGDAVTWNEGTQNFCAYFPYRASNVSAESVSVSVKPEQKCMPGDISYLKKSLTLYAEVKDVTRQAEALQLSFKSIEAVVELKISSQTPQFNINGVSLRSNAGDVLAYSGALLNLLTGELTLPSEAESLSSKVGCQLLTPVDIHTETISLYLAVNPIAEGKELDIVLESANGEETVLGTVTVPAGGIKANTVTTLVVGGGDVDIVDLSAAGTANTYIVTRPGALYTFKADVKGNGVARSYTYNYNGEEVTRGYTDADIALAAESAKLVWYNTPQGIDGYSNQSPVVAESVKYYKGTIYFTTPDTFVNGNALIAAYDSSDNIIWSWNIWALEGYDAEAVARLAGSYTFMDRNLGAMAGAEVMDTTDPVKAAWAIGHYYQWGRKDPFPAATEYVDDGANTVMWGLPTYTPISKLANASSFGDFNSSNTIYTTKPDMSAADLNNNAENLSQKLGGNYTVDQAVAHSVKYPYRWAAQHFNNQGPSGGGIAYSWLIPTGDAAAADTEAYLWGSTDEFKAGSKTIYDPCPAGWMVPAVDAWGYFMTSSANIKKSYGVYSDAGLYFPRTGQRNAGFGGSKIIAVEKTNEVFGYHTSTMSPDSHIPFKSGYYGVTTGDTYTGAGYQVRCVKDNSSSGGSNQVFGKYKAVFIGDSITETWEPRTINPTFFVDNNFWPSGISGQTTGNIRNRFYADVVMRHPQVVVITCGTNDLAGNDNNKVPRTYEHMLDNIKAMTDMADKAGIRVVLGSVAPSTEVWWHGEVDGKDWNEVYPDFEKKVVEYNKLLKEYADSKGYVYCDYHAVLKDENDDLKYEYRYPLGNDQHGDHIHPNGLGFAAMEPVALEAVGRAMAGAGGAGGNGSIDDLDKWEW